MSTPSDPLIDAAHEPATVLMVEVGGRGGVTDYTEQLVGALTAQGRHVELVTARDHLYRLESGSVKVHGIVPWVRDSAPVGRLLRRAGVGAVANALAYVAILPRLARLARRADVVHAQGHHFPPLAALFSIVVRLVGRPLVTTAHNTFDRGRTFARSHRIIAAMSRTTIVHTEADSRRIRQRKPGTVVVIPHGEYGGLARTGGEADRAAAREALGFADGDVVALLFGQLRFDKGIGDLLEAALEVPELRVLLAGEDVGGLAEVGPLVEALGERVVIQEGFMPMTEAARMFAAADMVVLPYRMASQSGVLLLAYGFGRPVVAYPVGGLLESVEDGETGWLTADATPGALAASLREAAATDAAERFRRGEAGRRLSEDRYSWSAIARGTAAVYESAARGRSTGVEGEQSEGVPAQPEAVRAISRSAK